MINGMSFWFRKKMLGFRFPLTFVHSHFLLTSQHERNENGRSARLLVAWTFAAGDQTLYRHCCVPALDQIRELVVVVVVAASDGSHHGTGTGQHGE
jgi:hypothetical protein